MTDQKPKPTNGWFDTIKALAQDLPPIMRYGIVFIFLLIFSLALGQTMPPDYTNLLYFFAIAGFLGYLWWDYQQTQERRAIRQHELDKKRLEQEQSPPPKSQPALPDPPQLPPPDDRELLARFLREQKHQCGTLSMANIDVRAKQNQAALLELRHVFTHLDVIRRADERMQYQKAELADHEPDPRQPVMERLSQSKQLVLLGKPGSGKSTLVKFVAYCLASEGLKDADSNLATLVAQGWSLPALLPIRVILRDYAARGLPKKQALFDFVMAELTQLDEDFAPFSKQLHQILRSEGGILLLDGLDEVPEAYERRDQLRSAIAAFRRDYPQVRILVTSRPYAYDDPQWQLPDFERAELLDFSAEQIVEYIDKWYRITGRLDPDLGVTRAEQYAEQLKRELEHNFNLQELAPRPLLLALMVSLHCSRGGGALPQEREKLYNASVDLLIDRWQRPKNILDAKGHVQRQETSALTELGIDHDGLRYALSEAAFWAHKNQPDLSGTAEIPARKLAEALYAAPNRQKDTSLDRIIDYVRDRAGLLQDDGPVGERGEHLYSFPHRTFQEYLAACYLLEQPSFPDQLVDLVRQDLDRWREATLLTAGRANAPATVWALADGLALPDSKLEGRDLADPLDVQANATEADWQGAFLAGQVLLEKGLTSATSERLQEKLDRVRQGLLLLNRSGAMSPRDRAIAGADLAKLGDPRRYLAPHSAADLAETPFCYVPAGEFWLGSEERKEEQPVEKLDLNYGYWLARYPVTAGQFKLFLAESGYKMQGDRDYVENDPATYPARAVSWHDALAFCRWLAQATGVKGVTLPSEVEWEKGARGGLKYPKTPILEKLGDLPQQPDVGEWQENELEKRLYPWGNEFEPTRTNSKESGIGEPSPVGAFPGGSSPYECEEMMGNVWEWSRSHWGSYPYQLDGKREDLRAGNDVGRVLRGGACYSGRTDVRCSSPLFRLFPDFHGGHNGFRLVVSPLAS